MRIMLAKPTFSHVTRTAVVIVVLINVSTYMLKTDPALKQPDDDAKIVAYYQTSGLNKIASNMALSLFRSVYPEAQVYIHYDTDHIPEGARGDMTTFNNKHTDQSVQDCGMHFSTVRAMESYIKRVQKAASLQPKGWVLLLEDDVWVWTQINPRYLRYDVTGTCWATFTPAISRIILAHSRHHVFKNATCYGAYGGHYVNSSRVLGLRNYHGFLRALLIAARGIVPSDLLLSALILGDGGTIGDNPGYYEYGGVFRPVAATAHYGPLNILHQMKWLYFMRYIAG